jgi:hypothetical protein
MMLRIRLVIGVAFDGVVQEILGKLSRAWDEQVNLQER